MAKPRRLNPEEAKEIAREATRTALKAHKERGLEIPQECRDALNLAAGPEGDCYVFELYAAAERPEDAQRWPRRAPSPQ